MTRWNPRHYQPVGRRATMRIRHRTARLSCHPLSEALHLQRRGVPTTEPRQLRRRDLNRSLCQRRPLDTRNMLALCRLKISMLRHPSGLHRFATPMSRRMGRSVAATGLRFPGRRGLGPTARMKKKMRTSLPPSQLLRRTRHHWVCAGRTPQPT